jgi:hypothetical protein
VIGSAPVALARARDWLYLNRMEPAGGGNAASPLPVHSDGRMAQPISTPQQMIPVPQPSRKVATVIVAGGAGFGTLVLLGALGLWFHYGTAVFYEMIASGFSACF